MAGVSPVAKRPISYLQTDPRWKALPYAVKGEPATIGGSGCGPTAAAMVLATLISKDITPVETCKWAVDHGYKCLGNGTYYSYFSAQGKAHGLNWEQLNYSDLRKMASATAKKYHESALQALKTGDYLIVCMGPGNWTTGGHFILIYDVDLQGNVYYIDINDPASTRPARTHNTLALMQSQAKYYFICHMPVAKEEIDMTPDQLNQLIDARVVAKLEATKEAQWYPTLQDVPKDYQPAIQRLMTMPRKDDPTRMVLTGYDGGEDGDIKTIFDNNIRVDETFCRVVTTLFRAGAL